MYTKLKIVLSLTILLVLAGFSSVLGQESGGPELGDQAPPIIASKWVRGEPIMKYESGHVYVIDMWSTWCKACITSMPALHDLESKYDEGVTFVAMDVWEMEPARVPKFMETSGEFMPAYVAMDSIPAGKEANEGHTSMAFLGTSENITIPKTYLIDQKGRIAWVGHPDKLGSSLFRVGECNAKLRHLEVELAQQQIDHRDQIPG